MLCLMLICVSLLQVTFSSEFCSQEPLELGIVLDSSSSIRGSDFVKGITFLQDYLQQFDIGSDTMRVSIIPFAKGIYTNNAFNLTTYTTKEDVISAIGRITHEKGLYTDTGKGIKYMREVQLNDEVVRPGVIKIGLVITDGNSQDSKITAAEAEAARDSGIVMFAVGVGNEIGDRELLNIAGDMSRVAKVDNYDQLNSIIKSLANMTCIKKESTTTISPNEQGDEPTCGEKNPTDIYFLFSPADLGTEKTIWTTDFILRTIVSEDIKTGFRYGVISGSCPDDEGFNLDRYSTAKEIRNRLKSYETSKLISLSKQLADSGYTSERGARPNAKKVAVLVVSGVKSAELVSKQVKNLLDQGITVFIADPTDSGVKIEGATTLKGQSLAQAEELIHYLCNPCQPATSK
ncbi:collagen alpha-5(VI) chain-like [Biomphalaria glabrata]|uniref:Collagen alpha-5(VI) chain-like n=1 Tax=Biomphalaria glabrata TaxID=6526 RepID=A0A9W2YKK7_BIOGL|nr:collagen alpha-5(VI) chain-like [Biomphalaria glabrata]